MDMNEADSGQSYSIINTAMTVEAMRDSGYKSTAHALAEIVDNSLEAGATSVEIFGVSRQDPQTGRITLAELAVLDNGSGMDATTLRRSLRYGDGTRRERKGIGRFGVGLPNSSLSQGRRVDLWSWRAGVTNALHTHLSVEDVLGGATEIPVPELRPIPQVYREASDVGFEESGTLVVWSELDRVQWKRAATTFKHVEYLLGRIYRRFIARPQERVHAKYAVESEALGPRRTITLIAVCDNDEVLVEDKVPVRPNDPLYLMTDTSCPSDYGPEPMFQELEGSPFAVEVRYRGQNHYVRLRASYARPHARDYRHPNATWPLQYQAQDAGHSPWGKHAAGNIGVSMVRADRELEIDASWATGYDPTDRWWKVEVDFPPALDDAFGVTNNKQGTTVFQRLAHFDWNRELLPGEESKKDIRKRMEEEGDERLHLLDLREQIQRCISSMRPKIEQSGKKRGPRHVLDEDQKADLQASATIRRRLMEGHKGESDIAEESGDETSHKDDQVRVLVDKHQFTKEEAVDRVLETIEAGSRVRWIQSAQESPAFFDVDVLPGVIQVALNTKHPVYSHLYELMHIDVDGLSEVECRARLARAAAAFRVLVYAWARYEDEQTDASRRHVRNARHEWGKYAEDFFDDEGDGSPPPSDLV